VEMLQKIEGEGNLRMSEGGREEPSLQQLRGVIIECAFTKPNAIAMDTVCVHNMDQIVVGNRWARKTTMTKIVNGAFFGNERTGGIVIQYNQLNRVSRILEFLGHS